MPNLGTRATIQMPRTLKYASPRTLVKHAVSLHVYREIEKKLRPVLHHFFLERWGTPSAWFERRLAYSRSLAASSMASCHTVPDPTCPGLIRPCPILHHLALPAQSGTCSSILAGQHRIFNPRSDRNPPGLVQGQAPTPTKPSLPHPHAIPHLLTNPHTDPSTCPPTHSPNPPDPHPPHPPTPHPHPRSK